MNLKINTLPTPPLDISDRFDQEKTRYYPIEDLHAKNLQEISDSCYNCTQTAIGVLDFVEILIPFLFALEGSFRLGLSTQLLGNFIFPVGSVLLMLRSAVDLYAIKSGEKFCKTFDSLEKSLQQNKKRDYIGFIRKYTGYTEKQITVLSEGTNPNNETICPIAEEQKFLRIKRSTSSNIAEQFAMLKEEEHNNTLTAARVEKVLKNAKTLIYRKTIVKTIAIGFSVIAAIAVLFAFWAPVALGLSIVSLALLGRFLLSLYEHCFLERDLKLNPQTPSS